MSRSVCIAQFLYKMASKKLWVKFGNNNAVKVSTEECQDVDDFLKACKKELSPLFDSYAPAQLSLSLTKGGEPFRPGHLLADIPQNTDERSRELVPLNIYWPN